MTTSVHFVERIYEKLDDLYSGPTYTSLLFKSSTIWDESITWHWHNEHRVVVVVVWEVVMMHCISMRMCANVPPTFKSRPSFVLT